MSIVVNKVSDTVSFNAPSKETITFVNPDKIQISNSTPSIINITVI